MKNGEITEDEEITLIGFSAGGLVSRMAAKSLYEKTGKKVNVITINSPAPENEEMEEHPCSAQGINDMIIFETEGDDLSKHQVGQYEHMLKSVPENYQFHTLKSNARGGFKKHFAEYIDIEHMKTLNVERLKPVPTENTSSEDNN